MMLLVALSTVPEKAAPARDLRWLAMLARIVASPYCTSSGDFAYTNVPRALIAACQRSSTATAPLLLGGNGGLLGAVRLGHCSVPPLIAASVAAWLPASSVPAAPNEIAEKLTCCHHATSFVGSRSLGALPDHDGTLSFNAGRRSRAQ